MNNTKSTKRALLLSIMAMLLCVVLLVGTTFAWFTDSASTGVNKIQAGTLDVQLLMYDGTGYVDISNDTRAIFGTGSIAQNNNAETLWEPGKTQVAYLAIKNNGNLALKYKVELNVTNVSKDMYKAMKYAIIPDAQPSSVTSWTDGSTVVAGTQHVSDDVSLPVGVTHYFALAIHMNEDAGNEYQGGEVDFDLTVVATQDTVENDSFGNQYDRYAQYPDVTVVQLAAGDETAVNNAFKDAIAAAKTADATGKPTPTQIVLPSNTTVCLDSGEATPAQGLTSDIKITGDKTTTVKLQNTNPGSEGSLSYQDGANLTFQGITVDTEDIKGICARGGVVTFIDCTFNSELKQTIAAKFIFSGCTFTKPVSQVGYGCKDVIFSNCKFNTDGYGIKIYSEGNSPVNLTVKNCAFNNSGSAAKSAIFLDHIIDGISYNITVDSCSFSGFTATPTANDNQYAPREIVADSFVKTSDGSDGQYIFSYQTGAESGSYHKILTDDQLVVTVN